MDSVFCFLLFSKTLIDIIFMKLAYIDLSTSSYFIFIFKLKTKIVFVSLNFCTISYHKVMDVFLQTCYFLILVYNKDTNLLSWFNPTLNIHNGNNINIICISCIFMISYFLHMHIQWTCIVQVYLNNLHLFMRYGLFVIFDPFCSFSNSITECFVH